MATGIVRPTAGVIPAWQGSSHQPERAEDMDPCLRRDDTWLMEERRSDLLHALDARHEMPQQILDAVAERRGRGRAARAGALHVEEHGALLEALEGDVAAVHRHRGPDAGRDQLLDDLDGLGVALVEELLGQLLDRGSPSLITGLPERKCSMIAPSTAGLMWAQSTSSLVTEMKSEPRNTPVTPGSSKERRGKRRNHRRFGRAEVARLADEQRRGRAGTSGSPDWAWLRSG